MTTTSTLQDILNNTEALYAFAEELLAEHAKNDEDWWDTRFIGDLAFDFNIFDWGNGTVVSVYPVSYDDDPRFGSTDHSSFKTLLKKKKKTGVITKFPKKI